MYLLKHPNLKFFPSVVTKPVLKIYAERASLSAFYKLKCQIAWISESIDRQKLKELQID